MKFDADIDIDFPDRIAALALIKHTPACIITEDKISKHNSGIYVTDIPVNGATGNASLDYKKADERGYFKFDFLNVTLYQQIKSEEHLEQLMNTEPDWCNLYDPEFCSKLIHIGNHYDTLIKMPQAVNSIPRMAMFLSVIRPAKRHLIGLPWTEVAATVWERPVDDSYYFKKSHSISYSHLVVVHMNLLDDSSN